MTRHLTIEWVCDCDNSHVMVVGPRDLSDPDGWIVIRVQNKTYEYCPECAPRMQAVFSERSAQGVKV